MADLVLDGRALSRFLSFDLLYLNGKELNTEVINKVIDKMNDKYKGDKSTMVFSAELDDLGIKVIGLWNNEYEFVVSFRREGNVIFLDCGMMTFRHTSTPVIDAMKGFFTTFKIEKKEKEYLKQILTKGINLSVLFSSLIYANFQYFSNENRERIKFIDIPFTEDKKVPPLVLVFEEIRNIRMN